METTTGAIPCPICGTGLQLTVTTNRHGKHAIGVHCPRDGRHFRGFINDHAYVVDMLARLADVMTERLRTDNSGGEALHNSPKRPRDGSAE